MEQYKCSILGIQVRYINQFVDDPSETNIQLGHLKIGHHRVNLYISNITGQLLWTNPIMAGQYIRSGQKVIPRYVPTSVEEIKNPVAHFKLYLLNDLYGLLAKFRYTSYCVEDGSIDIEWDKTIDVKLNMKIVKMTNVVITRNDKSISVPLDEIFKPNKHCDQLIEYDTKAVAFAFYTLLHDTFKTDEERMRARISLDVSYLVESLTEFKRQEIELFGPELI